jgi:hypothetical protein
MPQNLVDPATFAYFGQPERAGETPDAVAVFTEAYREVQESVGEKYGPSEYPLFVRLRSPPESSEELKHCDEIFAQYLREVALKTNEQYFRLVAKFVILYRECLNKYGWLKLFETNSPQIETEEDKSKPCKAGPAPKITRQILLSAEQINLMKEEYCTANNAEFAPELVNELVALYLSEHNCGLPTTECINLAINICEWLYTNGYTCTKVSIIKK